MERRLRRLIPNFAKIALQRPALDAWSRERRALPAEAPLAQPDRRRPEAIGGGDSEGRPFARGGPKERFEPRANRLQRVVLDDELPREFSQRRKASGIRRQLPDLGREARIVGAPVSESVHPAVIEPLRRFGSKR